MLGQRTLAWVDERLRQQHGTFINQPPGRISICSFEILHSYHLLEISLFMLFHPSLVLYSHNMDIPFMVFFYAIGNIRQAGNNRGAQQFRAILLR